MKLRSFIAVLLTALLLTACGPAAPDSLPVSSSDSLSQSISQSVEQPPESENPPALPENEDYQQLLAAADPEQYILTNFVSTVGEEPVSSATGLKLLDFYVTESTLDILAAVSTADVTDDLYRIIYTGSKTTGTYRLTEFEQCSLGHFTVRRNTDKTRGIISETLRPNTVSWFLVDLVTNETHFLCRQQYRGDREAGFFKNGDIYIMSGLGMNIFSAEGAKLKFTSETNFPCGKGYDPDQPDRERWLLALRREENQQGYIVMYAECTPDETGNYPLLAKNRLTATYQVGILDAEGRLTASWDTYIPCFFNNLFKPVSMYKPDDDAIAFRVLAETYGGELFHARVDLTTGECTEITE